MNIKECILDNRKCRDIILQADEITSITYFKKDNKELYDIDKLLNKKVKTSERIENLPILLLMIIMENISMINSIMN